MNLNSLTPPHLLRLSQKYPGKRAFITGAGSGLGLAFAADLARVGWNIGISDIDESRLFTASEELSKLGATAVSTYLFDVGDYAAFGNSVSAFVEDSGGIEIGINNAGIGCGGLFHEISIELFRRVVEVNLMGVVNGCHHFVPIMRRQRSGHILNVASAAAFVTPPRMSAYNTTKGAVVALSETLHNELHDEGISVSVLMPTYVRTNIGRDALGSVEDNRLASLLVDQSRVTAAEVAHQTFRQMLLQDFYIVLPSDAKFMWNFKRLFPDRFLRFIKREASRIGAELEPKLGDLSRPD